MRIKCRGSFLIVVAAVLIISPQARSQGPSTNSGGPHLRALGLPTWKKYARRHSGAAGTE